MLDFTNAVLAADANATVALLFLFILLVVFSLSVLIREAPRYSTPPNLRGERARILKIFTVAFVASVAILLGFGYVVDRWISPSTPSLIRLTNHSAKTLSIEKILIGHTVIAGQIEVASSESKTMETLYIGWLHRLKIEMHDSKEGVSCTMMLRERNCLYDVEFHADGLDM